jgi:hypothetical protein
MEVDRRHGFSIAKGEEGVMGLARIVRAIDSTAEQALYWVGDLSDAIGGPRDAPTF